VALLVAVVVGAALLAVLGVALLVAVVVGAALLAALAVGSLELAGLDPGAGASS
jgi:hypothetical protein